MTTEADDPELIADVFPIPATSLKDDTEKTEEKEAIAGAALSDGTVRTEGPRFKINCVGVSGKSGFGLSFFCHLVEKIFLFSLMFI